MNELQSALMELYARRALCDQIIRELMKMDDPRAPSALEHYKGQQAELDGKITTLEKQRRMALGIPEPEPIVVGLKPAMLTSKVERTDQDGSR